MFRLNPHSPAAPQDVVILQTDEIVRSYVTNVTKLLKVTVDQYRGDLNEILWQILERLTVNDITVYNTFYQMEFPDLERMFYGEMILADSQLEQIYKELSRQLAMQLHHLVKNMGLYDLNRIGMDDEPGFNFMFKGLIGYDVVILPLPF